MGRVGLESQAEFTVALVRREAWKVVQWLKACVKQISQAVSVQDGLRVEATWQALLEMQTCASQRWAAAYHLKCLIRSLRHCRCHLSVSGQVGPRHVLLTFLYFNFLKIISTYFQYFLCSCSDLFQTKPYLLKLNSTLSFTILVITSQLTFNFLVPPPFLILKAFSFLPQ